MHTKVDLDKKHIVILGGGYCGLRVAKLLAKKLANRSEYQIILVDRNSAHLYPADLYEIATAYSPDVNENSLRELSDSITIPYSEVFKGSPATFLLDTVTDINYSKKKVTLEKTGNISFEYLVIALGSVTNFYDLPGIREHSFPIKSIDEAIALQTHFETLFRERSQKNIHTPLHVVVGGGGFTGVEFACELPGYIRRQSKKYHFDPLEVKITVIHAGPELVNLGQNVSCFTLKRFKDLGVNAVFNTRILGYNENKLEVQPNDGNQKKHIPADVLVWTAGVQPNPLLKTFPVLHESGCLDVEPNLESAHYPKVYAGGDNAAIFDIQNHEMLPKLGALAVQQAPVIAHNIWADITKQPPKVYVPKFTGYIISLGAKYYLYHNEKRTCCGLIQWFRRRKFDLWYFASLLPFKKALKKWWKTTNIFIQND